MDAQPFQELYIRARDGLKLHVRHYPAPKSSRRDVLCLPGLTRNHRDFHKMALALSSGDAPRNVYCLDYRGRGQSEWDSDWKNYAVPIETLDVIDVLFALGLHNLAVIGTSRGGLIAMVLAAAQPTMLGAVVLNDIGPVVETDGLTRIATYVGRIPLPRTWKEAGHLIANSNRSQFPEIEDDEWMEIARQWFNEKDGRPAHGYDPQLKNALSVLDGPMPELWAQFDALTRIPMLVVRGETSDILSASTVEKMARRHPNFSSMSIKKQGHAPFLRDDASISEIQRFLQHSETP